MDEQERRIVLEDIKRVKGLINWAKIASSLNYWAQPWDCIASIQESIKFFSDLEEYENAQYLFEELKKLEEYKNSHLI
jgi:hypothetical protein